VTRFLLPPRIFDENGELRTVGFEVEFGGVGLDETAQIIISLFGGRAYRESQYLYRITTELGEFQLEADSMFLKQKKYERYFRALGLDPSATFAHGLEDAIASLAGTLIPFEIVMPPLPIDKLDPVEQIRNALQRHSAQGTNTGIFRAFGMQFNPRVPDKKPETLTSYLRAFFLLFDWLYVETEVPLARKLAPFIHSFPEEYIELVLDPDYHPNLDALMTDYLEYNPTRNRPLDMLPLFADIDREKVFSYPVEKELVKSRPTFHYRLPNSEVDDPNWSVAGDWNKWIEIEKLTVDPARMLQMSEDYLRVHEDTVLFTRSKWVEKTRDWLHVH
jgi:hypothetical protein